MKLSSSVLAAALAAVATAQSATLVKDKTKHVKPIPTAIPPKGIVINFGIQGNLGGHAVLKPLLPEAHKQVANSKRGIRGALTLNNANTANKLSPKTLAFTNCNAPKNNGGMIDLPTVIQHAIEADVGAIIFYTTLNNHHCQLADMQGYDNYTSLFAVESPRDARQIIGLMNNPDYTVPVQSILTHEMFISWANKHEPDLGPLGGAGSTAVAMIILYSITGVITALFLIIIVTGAIRAHRHPERYGPRTVLGRPRQSRAKGIARAMLDTIPIVKFGERLPDPSKEVETGSSIAMERRTEQPAAERDETQATAGASEAQQEASSSSTAATPAAQPGASKSPADDDEGLGCSICTEDFERGQDIRVLPCNHKFHPACVDPWLLDVSGTCPLCRVDLNPAAANGTGEGQEGSSELPPPLDPASEAAGAALGPGFMRRRDTIRGFVTTRLNPRGLQGTSREERLEILRRWREAHRSQSTASAGAANSTTAAATTESDAPGDEANDAEERQSRLSRFSRLVRRRDR